MSSNTPTLMQSEEERAPWNEPLSVRHNVFVSITVSGYVDIWGPEDMSVEKMEESIRDGIKDGIYPKDFDIDEVVVMEE